MWKEAVGSSKATFSNFIKLIEDEEGTADMVEAIKKESPQGKGLFNF